MPLRLSPKARVDIDEMFLHGAAEFGLRKADDYAASLRDALDLLADQPMMGRARTEIAPPVRLYRYRAHHVLYRIDGNDILILRILHGSANWIDHLHP